MVEASSGEPGKQCCDCEFFDIGGEEMGYSDCLNRRSPRFQTYAHWTCQKWTPRSDTEMGQ